MTLKKEITPSRQDHEEGTIEDLELDRLGYKQELRRNRSVLTLLFQTLAIAAIPYGEGSPLLSAIYGGGPLSIFVGWIVVCLLDQCIAFSLAELASRYPTSAGPYYWTFQISRGKKTTISFINAWIWLIGNWTITLSVNFGFASLISATISIYHPTWSASSWQLLLIFYAVCLASLAICIFANNHLPLVDTLCATWTLLTIIIILIAISVKADTGRHSPSYTLSHYDKSFAGMISSMAEECSNPAIKVPRAIALSVPVGGIAGLFFIIPICATLPPLQDIITAPAGQALPYILARVMGSPAGGLGLISLVLVITVFCSISITVAASRATWAVARDDAIPLARLWARVDKRWGVPVWALVLLTVIQMLLGLINLGSTSAFTAFVSVGVIALAAAYSVPIFLSLWHGREEVAKAPWNCGGAVGRFVNVVALAWIAFELVLFSMPTSLPVTAVSMNYASVVFVGFMTISAVWFLVYARKSYKGPPASDALD
ncbi:Amino acid/polyamine transporter I [Penicillium coprophilum]|uniref:Amino acid/polyamine transporter I n=1 Tax=Penicillium coprophilum TaxID=36646 RepID=UPI00238635A7|nr:Amino acid/polyamine transporter I [Penicillium coprophilum]KAJ5159175.1 Amino acid/polyamine transporter I [Penicillium coprophilum]